MQDIITQKQLLLFQVEMSINCAYCEASMYSWNVYGCQCNPDLLVCSSCSSIECHGCNKRMKKIQFHNCSDCFNSYQPKYLLKVSHSKYCYKCCYKSLKKSSSAIVQLGHFNKLERSEVTAFLQSLCFKCSKKLSPQEIMSLKNSKTNQIQQFLCAICSSAKDPKRSEQNMKEEKYKKEKGHSEIQKQNDQKKKQQLFEMWRKKQNPSSISIKCMSCDLTIYRHEKNSIITEQMVICSLCSRRSKIQESQINKQKKWKQIKEDDSVMKNLIRSQRPEIQYLMADARNSAIKRNKDFQSDKVVKSDKKRGVQVSQLINKIKTEEQKKKVRQMQYGSNLDRKRLESQVKAKQKVKEQKEQSEPQELVEIQSSLELVNPVSLRLPQLKKSDSESRLENIQLCVKWTNDSEIVDCCKCGICIQAIYSIWEEQENAPFCKCCYADLLEKLREELRMKQINSRYGYKPKQVEPSSQKKPTNYQIGQEIVKKTQEKPRSKPKLMEIEEYDKLKQAQGKVQTTIISHASPKRGIADMYKKYQSSSKVKESQHRQISSAKKSSDPINKFNHKSQLGGLNFMNEPELMPNTKKLQAFSRSSVNYHNQAQKEKKKCAECGKVQLLSNRYLIRQKPVCVQCYGKRTLDQKRVKVF